MLLVMSDVQIVELGGVVIADQPRRLLIMRWLERHRGRGGIAEVLLAPRDEQRFPTAKALYNALYAYADWQELSSEVGSLVKEAKAHGATQLPNAQPASAVGT